MSLHLLVAISSHGFGHLAQVAPVINALGDMESAKEIPGFELTVRSSLPERQIGWRIKHPFNLDSGSDDFGMVMRDALTVDMTQSLRRYALLHQNWSSAVDRLAAHLQSLNVSHLLADTPYLTLAAAQSSGIPAAAICSLNWADILEQCARLAPEALKEAGLSGSFLKRILQQMRDAYASAAIVIRPEPAIETTGFTTVSTEPLADKPPAADRSRLLDFVRQATGNYLSGKRDCWLVLASMGGIALPLNPESWPTECLGRKVIYLMDPGLARQCPHAVGFELERVGFADMMASSDLVLTKPGYGMFVESRACGKPVLYIGRDDWPESACLEQWIDEQSQARKLSLAQVVTGTFEHEMAQVLQSHRVQRVDFSGARTAARLIASKLFAH